MKIMSDGKSRDEARSKVLLHSLKIHDLGKQYECEGGDGTLRS